MYEVETFLRRPAVEEATGLSRAGIYKLIARGEFPSPVHLTASASAVGWRASEIAEWQAARIADRDGEAA